jgi:hypothetical protein
MPRPFVISALSLSVVLATGCSGGSPTVTPPPVVPDLVFLTQSEPQAVNMDALYVGRVFVDDEHCTRLAGDGATVIWPAGFTVRLDGEAIRVIDNTGRDVGRLGESFWISGGEVNQLNPELHISYMDRAMAHESCPGKYWIAAEVR